jgi:hypothetical protein
VHACRALWGWISGPSVVSSLIRLGGELVDENYMRWKGSQVSLYTYD